MATNFTDLYPDLLPSLPGCPDITVDRAINRAATEFFSETKVWRANIVGATTGTQLVAVTSGVPANCKIVHLYELRYDEDPLERRTPVDMKRTFPREESGTPVICTLTEEDTINVLPYPATPGVIGIYAGRVAIAPTRTKADLPDDIFDRYAEALIAGTLSKLLIQPNQAWTNENLAGVNLQMFENYKLKAKRLKESETGAARKHVGAPYGGLVGVRRISDDY